MKFFNLSSTPPSSTPHSYPDALLIFTEPVPGSPDPALPMRQPVLFITKKKSCIYYLQLEGLHSRGTGTRRKRIVKKSHINCFRTASVTFQKIVLLKGLFLYTQHVEGNKEMERIGLAKTCMMLSIQE